MMFGTLTRIVSGGQTGADRGALNAARALSLPIGGWAPQGWRSEDGCIPLGLRQYMRESVSPNYGLRTRLNVQDSDGTLILSFADRLTGGSKFTVDQVKAQRKPCKHLVLPRGSGVVPGEVKAALWDWIDEHKIAVLNVAGPRESKERGIQAAAERVIRDLLMAKHRSALLAAIGIDDAKIDAMKDHVFRSAFANNGEGIKEAAKTGVLRLACEDCGSREPCMCAFHAYAGAELAAANEAMDRKDEIFASGKYREAGGPIQGLNPAALEADLARITTEIAENLASAPPPLFTPGSKAREFIDAVDVKCAALLEPASMPDFAPTPQDGSQVASFIADCASATTAEDFNRDNTGLIDRYYAMDGNGAGGSLRVVLEYGNYKRSSVEFCRDYGDGDKAGEALARALLALPDDVYEQVLPLNYCDRCGGLAPHHGEACPERGTDT